MKKLIFLLAISIAFLSCKSQTQISLNQIGTIWQTGKVPTGTNQTNTWYSLANYGRYNYSVAITGAGTCTVSGTSTSYTVTGAAQTSITAGTGISISGAVPSFTVTSTGATSIVAGSGISLTQSGTTYTVSVPYKKYVASLTQETTNAPVATVFENTLGGTLVWSYISTGTYRATLAGAFPNASKIGVFFSASQSPVIPQQLFSPSDYIEIFTYDETGNLVNEILVNCIIEIRVYP